MGGGWKPRGGCCVHPGPPQGVGEQQLCLGLFGCLRVLLETVILKEKEQSAHPVSAQGRVRCSSQGTSRRALAGGSAGDSVPPAHRDRSFFFNTDVANSAGLLLNVIPFKTVPRFVQVDIFLSQIFLLFFLSARSLSAAATAPVPRLGAGAALPARHVKVALRPRGGRSCGGTGQRRSIGQRSIRRCSIHGQLGKMLFPGVRGWLWKARLSRYPRKLLFFFFFSNFNLIFFLMYISPFLQVLYGSSHTMVKLLGNFVSEALSS